MASSDSSTTTTAPSTTTTTVAVAAPPPAGTAPSSGTVPLADPGEVTARIVQTPGGCRYDADAERARRPGTVHNPSGSQAVIEIDVTFSDATGELDSASDIEPSAPGETVEWEATTPAFDPPQGTLTCQVTQN